MQQGVNLEEPLREGVTVVTASAGSGKTHLLTQKYIELLLAKDAQGRMNPNSYRHILAVTFTNKATDEMKDRIIQKLAGKPKDSDEYKLLTKMLHDYSGFSVSTIDKFFQNVMRAFAREMDQYASYRVELDTKSLLSQVVDLMLASLEDPAQQPLREWLKEYALSRVEESEGWNITDSLKKMAGQFLDESFLRKLRDCAGFPEMVSDKKQMADFHREMTRLLRCFEEEALQIGRDGMAWMQRNQIEPDGLHYGEKGPTMIFKKWAERHFDANRPTPGRMEGAVKKAAKLHLEDGLDILFDRVAQLFEEQYETYCTAKAIRQQLYLLGIYADLQRGLQTYLQENNVVLLQMSNDILNRIIDDSDTPFVYEKIGNRYDHLMLDEAQDTSRMQWDNFRPLFLNSQSTNGRSLIVGDIKQSIYRWRGSDWHLMDQYIKEGLISNSLFGGSLDQNWRSGDAIISFNNEVFAKVGDELKKLRDETSTVIGEQVNQIYGTWDEQRGGTMQQTLPAKHAEDPQGYVRVRFLDMEKEGQWRKKVLESLLQDIAALQKDAYKPKHITILVRKNREGEEVAEWLMQNGIRVITEDSLLIGTSPCICKLMVLLSGSVEPDDPVNKIYALHQEPLEMELQSTSLYEMCEQMLHSGVIPHTEHDIPFINAFLDAVLDYQEKYGSSLRNFVAWWNETGRKLKICAPDGEDAVRVMTIHKAKGLSIDAAIIPFCTESFAPRFQPTIWCEPKKAPFSQLRLVPLKASGSMENTLFKSDYQKEKCLEYIDVINTWYVAFTRARTRLLVYAPLKKAPKEGYKPDSIEQTLYLILSNRLTEDLVFETGIRESFCSKKDGEDEGSKKIDDPQPLMKREPLNDRLKLTLHGDDYFAQEKSARQLGIEKHRDMASVEVDAMLEAQSGHRHWFDGTYRVMNEASIVDSKGEIKRPDRVLIAPDGSRVIVIDYKFGQPLDGYKYQVRAYVRLLKEMGYPSVEGWLWYVSSGEIVRV